jgi:DNA-directed RNA polymerase specialized sigma24 family protein
MTDPEKKRVRTLLANHYATVQDFCSAFSEGMNELYQLAFLLTADRQLAERCFVSGLEESVTSNRVFKEWALSWARRTIIQNAIRELMPHPPMASSGAFTAAHSIGELPGLNRHFTLDWILALGDFDRFVFVMSVLESYSDQDCALLLDCSPQQVEEARVRAVTQFTGTTAPMH